MSYHNIVTAAVVAETCLQMSAIVLEEDAWRVLPKTALPVSSQSRVTASRWQSVASLSRECSAETPDHSHVVKIALRSMNIQLAIAGRPVQDGTTMPGVYHITEPGAPVRCLFRGPYDVLHLHVPNSMIDECARGLPRDRARMLNPDAHPIRDSVVEQLGRSLLDADRFSSSFGLLYSDAIGLAIVARLLASGPHATSPDKPYMTRLPRWRLKRAMEYVETHLGEQVTLADVAAATGLTRMHFAAQFRAATGLRPHEYLLRRRIERAQEKLTESSMSIIDVALSMGFQTQSHFTTVFRRFTGQTPRTWRLTRGATFAASAFDLHPSLVVQ